MIVYSHIVILSTSLLLVGNLLPAQGGIPDPLPPPVSQTKLPAKGSTSTESPGPLFGQHRVSALNRSKAPRSLSHAPSAAISDPPFLRHPIQFDPNSIELTVVERNTLKRAAGWLRQHREARILIVGSCDSGGSERCTHTLAEGRGTAVRMFLASSGLDSDQIAGVKGWDKLDQGCPASDTECQQFNRSARIFMASSIRP